MSMAFVCVILACILMANNAVNGSPHWNLNADESDVDSITASKSSTKVNLLPRTIDRNENDGAMNICPCNWMYLDGRCYYVSNKTTTSWTAARAFCRARGGDLAVPKDPINNHHIYSAMKKRNVKTAWIGLYRVAEGLGHKFFTVQGVKPSFTNWMSGEPNDHGGAEDCVELSSRGEWNDIPTKNRRKHFICQVNFQS